MTESADHRIAGRIRNAIMPDDMRWWAGQDSNLQPDRYERPALTIELPARRRRNGCAVARGSRH